MEAVIFIGIQASGKTTFYVERFFHTHVRLSLDMLRTRHRLDMLLRACIAVKQRFVVDNTNLTAAERAYVIDLARAAGLPVVGYYFESRLADCLRRNDARPAGQRVPPKGVAGAAKRLEPPALTEGFDALYNVRIAVPGSFTVTERRDAV